MLDNPKWTLQVALEKEMTADGVRRYEAELAEARAKKRESDTPAGLRLLRAAIEPTAAAIKLFIDEASTGKAGRRHLAAKLLEGVDPFVAAYLTSRVVIDMLSGRPPWQRLGVQVGLAIEDEVRFRTFEQMDEEKFGITERHLKKTSNVRHRRRVMVFQMNRAGVAWEGWTESDRVHLGTKLVELMATATGLVEIVSSDRGRLRVTPTEETLKWLEQSNARHALLCPTLMPMVVPPKPWTSPLSGGYWTNAVRRQVLVKGTSRAFLDELFGTDLSQVYASLNAIQNTPWRVNRKVLEVARTMWDRGLGLGTVLPSRDGRDLPPKPLWLVEGVTEMSEEQKQEFKAWKARASEVYTANARSASRRVQASRVLTTAERFAGEVIYFPHNLDFRGRIYAIPPFLNPQGNDLAKGLLTFADAKPLGNHVAAGWLAVHGANVYGYDKDTLEGRIGWVEQNQEVILRCAADPLSETFWQDADSPWCFLAFCFEWAGFVEQGLDYLSSLPIALDGSCNGIQHYSAMLRDEVGGAAVNLVPAEKPGDIYARVAEVTTDKLRLIASTSVSDAPAAGHWLAFGIDRKITKRSVMVLPYGGTYMSCRDYVLEAVRERFEAGTENPWGEDHEAFSKAIHLLAATVWKSISEVVVGARRAMSWLQSAARLATKTSLPINWQTPSGFWVQQAYKETKLRRIKTKLFGEVAYISLLEQTNEIDDARQINGIAPNFVHSMDAAALVGSVNIATENGIAAFSMVHDSYGTLAADTEMLGHCLRHAFVDMYEENDVLAHFHQQVSAMLPADALKKLAPPPATGRLDLSTVLQSDFFFA